MSIYLEVILWWLIVPALAVAAGCGIWRTITHCRHQYTLARLWDDNATGAGPRGLLGVPPRGTTIAGPGTSYPYDQDAA